MIIKFKNIILLFFAIFANQISIAQEVDSSATNILKYSLQDLMKMQISVASQQAVSLNESPGVITVITEVEIKNSGAKDLISVLKLVPSIDFGSEWDNIIGIGIRGNNATEGKFLLLIDGHQMNETNFGTFPFGGHILVDNIRQIEIIRGPGSVIYGGSAELAVINIITKKGGEIKGTNLSTEYSISNSITATYNTQLSIGNKFINGVEYKISAYYGNSNRSNETLNTLDTSKINYADNSNIVTTNLNSSLKYKNFNASFLYDKFLSQNTEFTGSVLYKGIYLSTDYQIYISKKITLKPKLSFKSIKPWSFVKNSQKEIFNTTNSRHIISIPFIYDSHKKIVFTAGSEIYFDVSRKDIDSVYFISNNRKDIHFYNLAFYSEAVAKFKFFNATIGGRYDYHEIYGYSFVPRIAFTSLYKKFNFKILYALAFKAPTISNIDYNTSIIPENTNVAEIEIGYQFNKKMGLYFNLYDIKIENPIFYVIPPVDNYKNFPSTGSRGFEIEHRINKKKWYVTTSYSYYKQVYNKIPDYNIETNSKTYGAFPTSKLTMNSSFEFFKHIKVSPSFIFYGNRFTYIHTDKNWTDDAEKLIKYNPELILNLNIRYLNLFTKGLDFSIGIFDILNIKHQYINAYHGCQNQIPDMGREFSVKLTFDFIEID
jgi:outer membrane cobalamin receptor